MKLVAKHQKEPQVAQLLEEYSAPVIWAKLHRLLGDEVFESALKAKMEFPELFEVSRAQSAEGAVSEAEAAAGHAKAVEEEPASSDLCHNSYEIDDNSGKHTSQAEESIGLPAEPESADMTTRVPSVFPVEFPFTTGYSILVKTQEVLEFACFRYAEKAMPEILAKRKWRYPESGELNLWAIEFSRRARKVSKTASNVISPSRPLKELFLSIAQIRHHAVHRIPVTAKELERFMADGETLARLFNDESAIHVMSRARIEVQNAAAEMENRKNMLQGKLRKILLDVADKRAELDRIEAEAMADMRRKDDEYQLFAGAHLRDTMWSNSTAIEEGAFAAQQLAANGLDQEYLEDNIDIAFESDLASYGDTETEDAVDEGPKSSALGQTSIGHSDGDSAAAKIEEAPNESIRPAHGDGDGDGDGSEVENPVLSSNSSADIHEPEAFELRWPHVSRLLGMTTVENYRHWIKVEVLGTYNFPICSQKYAYLTSPGSMKMIARLGLDALVGTWKRS